MKKIIVLSMLFASFFTQASVNNIQHSNATLETQSLSSKAEAFDQGWQLVAQLNDLSSRDLNQKLNLSQQQFNSKVALGKSTVKVEELSTQQGTVSYKAIVTTPVSYQQWGSDR
ncbi:DUF3316 domain-containing protein [Agarivorans sp. QJM3NY_29]|uniref:DUF3316 domain-containing protein n=1 Tax=unclassified Agarivorans TaxID=2636026 RepID=UPI003D7CD0D7